MRLTFCLLLLCFLSLEASAQFLPFPTGANRPDVSWHQITTQHFTIIYHDGLEPFANEAADVAEAVYPVVTGNLQTPLARRTPIYISDLDDIPNAFAFDDDYVYIWMRGILDDMRLGGIRSAGRAKWFRAVITHEFTHTVIAAATKTWVDNLFPVPAVPRWFNEGTARFMEPDGWTSDVDMVLRVAAVNTRLGYDPFESGALDGTLLYETGHSLVRYMTWRFGDTVLAKILHGGRSLFGYDFDDAVRQATGKTMSEIQSDWRRMVTVLYGAEYYNREEITEFSEPITQGFSIVTGIRYSPDAQWVAVLGRGADDQSNLYLMRSYRADSLGPAKELSSMSGFDAEFSWSPDGSHLVLSKSRYGRHDALVHDLYIIDREDGDMRRLTSDAGLTDPVWSPDGRTIVAVEKRFGRDNLVVVNVESGAISRLTSFDGDVQLYTPSFSPDGTQIAFSLFDEGGERSIAILNAGNGDMRRLTRDTANNRYPVWSPDGRHIAFTSHASGIPNLQVMNADGSGRRFITDAAGGLYSVQWMPGSDSIVAISFDTRDKILPHLIPATRTVKLSTPPKERDKYMAWQRVHLPLMVPAPELIVHAARLDSGRYSSLANVTPLVPLFPLVNSDIARSSAERGYRLGAATLWNDPMNIQNIGAYVDYGFVSKEFGGELAYVNNYLPITVALHAGYALGFERIVADSAYFQRSRVIELMGQYQLNHPDRFDVSHTFSLQAGWRRLEPWNHLLLPDSVRPVDVTQAKLRGGYMFLSPHLFVNVTGEHAERISGADITYTRADIHSAARIDLPAFDIVSALDVGALWGDRLPQEFLGLDRNDQLEGGFRLSNLISPSYLRNNYRVRGTRKYMYGDRVAVGSIGVETELSVVEQLVPLLSFLRPSTVVFVEAGSAWYSDRTSLGDIPIIAGYGVELRSQLLLNLFLSAGLAYSFDDAHPDFYVRFVTGI
jgi:Tol biopolymer transport system component